MAQFCDVEAAVAEVLRSTVGCPVFGRLPADPPFPCVRVQRITGSPVGTRPLYLDAALVQVDVFADSQGQARSIVDTARSAMSAIHNTSTGFGWLTAARLGGLSNTPDTDFDPPKARYRFDSTVWGRVATPAPAP